MSSKKSINLKTLGYFLEACRQYKSFTAVCLVLSPLVVIFKDVVLPFVFAEIINYVSTDPSQEEIWARMLGPAVAVVVGYALTQAAFHQMRCVASHYLKAYGVKYLALKCFAAIEAQSMQFHYDSFSGSLVSYVNRFCSAYDEFINIILWDIFPFAFHG